MRETLLNNTLGHTKPNIDKLKNILSDNSVSLKNPSFDSYLDTHKPKINTQKPKISPKPPQQTSHNQKKNQEIVSPPEKQEASETTDVNPTENTTEAKTVDDSTQETQMQETLHAEQIIQNQTVSTPEVQTQILLSTLTQSFIPLDIENTSEQNLTALDTDTPLEAQIIEGINSLHLPQTILPTDTPSPALLTNPAPEFSLNMESPLRDNDEQTPELELESELDISDDVLSEMNLSLESQNIILTENTVAENIVLPPEKSDMQPIQIDIATDKNSGTVATNDIVPIQGIFQNSNNLPSIQFQKASSIESIAQIPLDNIMSVTITKDTDNDNKIGINLEPAGMGEVELVIETNSDNAVMAVIRSDKPEILEQLRKEAASLERYLTEAGLNLGGQGLGFEHRQNDNKNNQNANNSDTILNASILENALSDTQNATARISATERLYTHLDKQSIQTGLDIRL